MCRENVWEIDANKFPFSKHKGKVPEQLLKVEFNFSQNATIIDCVISMQRNVLEGKIYIS